MQEKHFTRLDLSPEELKVCDTISEFTISLIQAMIKTGYYSHDHPGTKKALSGLFPSFTQIVSGKTELTFIAKIIGEEKDIMIDGIFREPFALKQLLKLEMSSVYINKFAEFFEKKNLISFSVKNNIFQEEFDKFIELMSSPTVSLDKTQITQELTTALVANKIIHISTIFNEDSISGKERKLPWRVEVILTRLKKDLHMVPLYKHLSEEEMQKVKKQVFSDIIRPVKNHDVLKEILINCDLISRNVEGMKEVGAKSMEEDLIENISHEFVVQITSALATEIEEEKTKTESPSRYSMIMTIIRKTIPRLYEQIGTEEMKLFHRLFSVNILPLEKLPAELKEIITIEKFTDKFLLGTKNYFEELNQVLQTAEYLRQSELLIRIIPELIKRGKFPELEAIINLLNNHKKISLSSFPERAGLAASALEKIISKETIKYLIENFTGEEKTGEELFELIAEFGKKAMSLLIEFVENDQEIIRRNACRILTHMGEKVLDPLLKSAQKEKISWHVLRNIFMIFGDIGVKQEDILALLKENLHHSHFRVREESLFSLYKILGKESEHYLISALKDKENIVAEKACHCLGLLKSTRQDLLLFLFDQLHKKKRPTETFFNKKKNQEYINSQKAQEAAELAACYTLKNIAEDLNDEGQKKTEIALIEALKIKQGPGKILFFSQVDKSFKVRIEICKILGLIGRENSFPVLKKITKEKELFIHQAAVAALKKVEERINGSR